MKSPASYEQPNTSSTTIQPAPVFPEQGFPAGNIIEQENDSKVTKIMNDFQEVIMVAEAVYANRKYFFVLPVIGVILACILSLLFIPERFVSSVPLLIDNSSLPAIREEEKLETQLNNLLGRMEYAQIFYSSLAQASGIVEFEELSIGQFSDTPSVIVSKRHFNGLTIETTLPDKIFPQNKVKSSEAIIDAINKVSIHYNKKQYNLKDIIMNKEIRILDDKLKDMKYEREKLQERKAKVWAESNAKLVQLEYHLKGIAKKNNIPLDNVEEKNKTIIEMTENLDFLSNSGVNANQLLRILGLLEARTVLQAGEKEKYLNEVARIKSLFTRLDYDYSQSLNIFENLSKKKNEMEKQKNESIAHSDVLLPFFVTNPGFVKSEKFEPYLEESSRNLLKAGGVGFALGFVLAFLISILSIFRTKVIPFLEKLIVLRKKNSH